MYDLKVCDEELRQAEEAYAAALTKMRVAIKTMPSTSQPQSAQMPDWLQSRVDHLVLFEMLPKHILDTGIRIARMIAQEWPDDRLSLMAASLGRLGVRHEGLGVEWIVDTSELPWPGVKIRAYWPREPGGRLNVRSFFLAYDMDEVQGLLGFLRELKGSYTIKGVSSVSLEIHHPRNGAITVHGPQEEFQGLTWPKTGDLVLTHENSSTIPKGRILHRGFLKGFKEEGPNLVLDMSPDSWKTSTITLAVGHPILANTEIVIGSYYRLILIEA